MDSRRKEQARRRSSRPTGQLEPGDERRLLAKCISFSQVVTSRSYLDMNLLPPQGWKSYGIVTFSDRRRGRALSEMVRIKSLRETIPTRTRARHPFAPTQSPFEKDRGFIDWLEHHFEVPVVFEPGLAWLDRTQRMIITTEPASASKKTPRDSKSSFSTVFTRAYEREVVVNQRQ